MGDSLLIGAAKLAMDVRLCGPNLLWPEKAIVKGALAEAQKTGPRNLLTEDVQQGVSERDFIYSEVWISMGEPEGVWAERIKLLMPYQLNAEVIAMNGNPHTKLIHCLPAFHNTETEVGQHVRDTFGLDAMEVTEQVFEGPNSVVFERAYNRMHIIKAVLAATLGS